MNFTKQNAFTLAEMLIALLVIGIVAALTMPNLIYSHKKQMVETKLLKFYTNINQAIQLSELENGDKKKWDFSGENTAEAKLAFFNKYFAKYLNYSSTEAFDKYLVIYFADDSALVLESSTPNDSAYCINAKYAKQVPSNLQAYGSKCFSFGFYPAYAYNYPYAIQQYYNKGIEPYVSAQARNEDGTLIKDENGNSIAATEKDLYKCRWTATKIIQVNGWKIPDDYPWKL